MNFIKVPWLHKTLSPLPWKFSHCAPALRHYSLCRTLHLKCLSKFWIRLFLDNGSVINTVIICYLLHQTRILAFSTLCFFRYIPAYSVIFIVIKAYSNMRIFRLIQAYSAPSVTLAYSQPCHILNSGIFKTEVLFKTLSKVDQAYSEPCHKTLFSHIQAYPEPCAMLAYAETWNTWNPGIFRTFP